jgi:hypothetical protein
MSTTISGTSGVTFPDSTSMQTGQQACKAWVNFNGTGTVAIRESYNVSTITDNGTGDYTVNFTTAMPNANYSIVLTAGYTTDGGNPSFGVANRIGSSGNEQIPTSSNFRLNVDNTTGNANDSKYVYATIFSN